MNKLVSLKYVEEYQVSLIEQVIKASFDEIGGVDNELKSGMKVMLKVCMPVAESPDTALTTHPTVVRAVVNILSDMGIECLIADSPYKTFNESKLSKIYLNTGMLEVANLSSCELNMNVASTKLETPDAIRTKAIELMDAINDVDAIINLGKIKIDKQLGFSASCSNIFGLIPGEIKTQIINRTETFKDFNNYIIDILEALKDKLVLNILDGIVALEDSQTQRMLSLIATSKDPYAIDSAAMEIVGINKSDTLLSQAVQRNLFSLKEKLDIVGDPLDKFLIKDFMLPRISENARINKSCRLKQKIYFNHCQQRVKIDKQACKGCGICTKICPVDAIRMKLDKKGELYAEVDYKICIYCNKCHLGCPYEVIEMITPSGHKKIHKNDYKKTKKKQKEV